MIYEPREDSYLLNDYIKTLDLYGKKFLEIGVGSGLITKSAKEKGAEVTAVDINKEALNQLDNEIDKIESDLFENVNEKFDLIVFNPPYLPGANHEKNLEGSETWHGGEKGTEVSRRFLKECKDYLRHDGQAYIVASSLSDFEKLEEDFSLEAVEEKALFFEKLFLLRYCLE